jgi:hypothetical protein
MCHWLAFSLSKPGACVRRPQSESVTLPPSNLLHVQKLEEEAKVNLSCRAALSRLHGALVGLVHQHQAACCERGPAAGLWHDLHAVVVSEFRDQGTMCNHRHLVSCHLHR